MSRLITIGVVILGTFLVLIVGGFLFLGVTGQDLPFMSDEAKVEYDFKKKEMEKEVIKEMLE